MPANNRDSAAAVEVVPSGRERCVVLHLGGASSCHNYRRKRSCRRCRTVVASGRSVASPWNLVLLLWELIIAIDGFGKSPRYAIYTTIITFCSFVHLFLLPRNQCRRQTPHKYHRPCNSNIPEHNSPFINNKKHIKRDD